MADVALVIDYSNWRPPGGAAELKAMGVTGVVVYIAPAAWNWPKAIKPLELVDLVMHGISYTLVFEINTSDYLGGAATGQQHGQWIAQALADLNQPAGTPVYIAIDTNVLPANFSVAEAYLNGIKSVVPNTPLGLYGNGGLIEDVATKGIVVYGWESESRAFYGNGSPTLHTDVVQIFGETVPGLAGSYDVDHTLVQDWGQMPRPTAVIAAPPAKVLPAHYPPEQFQFADVLWVPDKGCWGMQYDWGVITLGGSFHGTMHGNPSVAGRVPARIIPAGSDLAGANPPLHQYGPNDVYECVATSGERYLPQAA